jgi:hypothetical protein
LEEVEIQYELVFGDYPIKVFRDSLNAVEENHRNA